VASGKPGAVQPDVYTKRVCDLIGLSDQTYLTDMSDDQLLAMTKAMKRVEVTEEGTTWSMGNPEMPFDIRQRLAIN
jgi:hypothetical protein